MVEVDDGQATQLALLDLRHHTLSSLGWEGCLRGREDLKVHSLKRARFAGRDGR